MFSALLDTCVLVPSRARDVLLEIASTGAYRPLWSSEILDEFERTLGTLLGKRGTSPEETDAYLTRLFRQMKTAFPDAPVTGWEQLVPTIELPDPDDRHVVAAAMAGRADVIVTGWAEASGTARFAERMFDPAVDAAGRTITGNRPWSAPGWRPAGR